MPTSQTRGPTFSTDPRTRRPLARERWLPLEPDDGDLRARHLPPGDVAGSGDGDDGST